MEGVDDDRGEAVLGTDVQQGLEGGAVGGVAAIRQLHALGLACGAGSEDDDAGMLGVLVPQELVLRQLG